GGTANTGTDLVAVSFDASGHGWAAGNPPGWKPGIGSPPAAFTKAGTPQQQIPPLLPLTASGASPTSPGPPPGTFTHTSLSGQSGDSSFLWSSIAIVPGTQSALAGGQVLAATPDSADPNASGFAEPVLVETGCNGKTTVLQFDEPDPVETGPSPDLV